MAGRQYCDPLDLIAHQVEHLLFPNLAKLYFFDYFNHILLTWFNTKVIFIGTLIKDCTPYSEGACKAAANALNLNWKSAGDYGTKGCYAYKSNHGNYPNNVYYGTGGTDDEKKMRLISSSIYRPDGHDCRSNKSL